MPPVAPRVSFVVACHDYGRYLGAALDGLLGQDFPRLEVIAIDDASIDETPLVLARYREDPRMVIVRHEQRHGNIRCNNEGLARARGEFVGIFDADDFLTRSDAVTQQVAMFDAHPRVGFIYTAHVLVDEQGTPFRTFRPWPSDYVRSGLDEFEHLVRGCYVQHSGTLVRRIFHVATPIYDATLPLSGDWDIWLRLAALHDVGYLSECFLAYRVHAHQMSQRTVPPRAATGQLLRTVDKAFAALDPAALERLGHLRRGAVLSALLHQTRTDRSHGRVRRSWLGLVDAARRAPYVLGTREFHWALWRLVALTAFGRSRYSRMVSIRDRVLGGKAPLA